MSKRFIIQNSFIILFLFLASCNQSGRSTDEVSQTEVLPDDIVEMRFDQIRLAGIDTGSVKMIFLASTLKVNGLIAVPPQDFATVCSPLGGFVRSSNLLPGKPVAKGQTLAIIENQEFGEHTLRQRTGLNMLKLNLKDIQIYIKRMSIRK
jgi:cobalt-zinc-cadmium efflux system membrane fusion protein